MSEANAQFQTVWDILAERLAVTDQQVVRWFAPDATDQLTDLQYKVLGALVERGSLCGPDLRDALVGENAGYNKTAGFYHLVKRMEQAGLIIGADSHKEENGRRYKVRDYVATATGRERFEKSAMQHLEKATQGIKALQMAH